MWYGSETAQVRYKYEILGTWHTMLITVTVSQILQEQKIFVTKLYCIVIAVQMFVTHM